MSRSAISVRDARSEDLGRIVDFNLRLARETESKALDVGLLARGVSRALADPDRLRYWMAERHGEVVGQSAVTREWSDWRAGWIWWLQSVYVVEPARGGGVFRALYTHIRDAARADKETIGLRLYVERENERAQRTYQALGMRPGGYHVFEELWAERFVNPGG